MYSLTDHKPTRRRTKDSESTISHTKITLTGTTDKEDQNDINDSSSLTALSDNEATFDWDPSTPATAPESKSVASTALSILGELEGLDFTSQKPDTTPIPDSTASWDAEATLIDGLILDTLVLHPEPEKDLMCTTDMDLFQLPNVGDVKRKFL